MASPFYKSQDIMVLGSQLVLAIIVLFLSGYSSLQFYAGGTPSQTALMAFISSWTIASCLYIFLASRYLRTIYHPYARVALDAFAAVLWLAGFVALAVAVNSMNGPNSMIDFDGTNSYVGAKPRFYASSVAAVVFGAFEWVLFLVSVTISVREVSRKKDYLASRTSAGLSGGAADVIPSASTGGVHSRSDSEGSASLGKGKIQAESV